VGSSTTATMLSGPGAAALQSLSKEDVSFLQQLDKAELHAHLNGCIPISTLQQLVDSHVGTREARAQIQKGIDAMTRNLDLAAVTDFFQLFPAVHQLTSDPENLRVVTDAVLDQFLSPQDGQLPQFQYLELRTTPRATPHMTRLEYLRVVLSAMERFPRNKCALIVSVDWRMNSDDAMDCVSAAVSLKSQGMRIVALDVCGDFSVSYIPFIKVSFHVSGSLTASEAFRDDTMFRSSKGCRTATYCSHCGGQFRIYQTLSLTRVSLIC
jgi:adenosine deaminase